MLSRIPLNVVPKMKHAGPDTLAAIAPLLQRLRAQPGLVERTPGCFYRKSTAFLHFHDDPTGLWADVKLQPRGFTRLRAGDAAEQDALVAAVQACLATTR